MDNSNVTLAYSTSTDGGATVGEVDSGTYSELDLYSVPSERSELDFPVDPRDYMYEYDYDSYEQFYDWCEVCKRATDHRAEHDDLVEQGFASYDPNNGRVFSHF